MNWQEMKKLAAQYGINTQGMKKEELEEMLKEKGALNKKGLVKVKVLNNDAEDNRDSAYVAVINERVQIAAVVPFGKEIMLPEPIVKNLESTIMQKFVPQNTKVGVVDKEVSVPKYTVVRV